MPCPCQLFLPSFARACSWEACPSSTACGRPCISGSSASSGGSELRERRETLQQRLPIIERRDRKGPAFPLDALFLPFLAHGLVFLHGQRRQQRGTHGGAIEGAQIHLLHHHRRHSALLLVSKSQLLFLQCLRLGAVLIAVVAVVVVSIIFFITCRCSMS